MTKGLGVRDHLSSHIHLTNCIHLKNHMHKHRRILADKDLMRELVALQKSRPLKDPSASPFSWHNSSSNVDVLLTRGERDALVNGTRSLGVEQHAKECQRMSKRPPQERRVSEKGGRMDSRENGVDNRRRVDKGESSRWFPENNRMCCNDRYTQEGIDLGKYIVSRRSELRNNGVKKKGAYGRDGSVKGHSGQVQGIPPKSHHVALYGNYGGHRSKVKQSIGEAEMSIHSNGKDATQIKSGKSRGTRRRCQSIGSLDAEAQNEMSVASNSFSQGRDYQRHHLLKGVQARERSNKNISGKDGHGSPWNWSSIHHPDGQSIPRDLSEPQLRIEGPLTRGRVVSDVPEALPLQLDVAQSQGSINNNARVQTYLEELGISADDLLRDIDSDLASEGIYREQHKLHRQLTYRHQNLTQKYTPRTFDDLVGQNLVAQALSNAITKRKVGLLYVFYGPHGTGKTTCARIFARALNCRSPENPKPCGSCDSCIAEDTGKNKSVVEVSPIRNLDFDVVKLFGNTIASWHHSHYRVFILDDCDSLSTDCWSAIVKAIDRSPRQVVFVLVCSTIVVLPHALISRCQKFYFPKLKDADIVHTLQSIAAKEDLEIDKDALKLIASRSDGSLRDAEMTLEQLSLLGQRISLCLVQELVGLISDEKLVDLLDLALTADTVNTVKNLRDIMESGIEPLVLMSQLATVITDILAGSYDIMKETQGRKFFRQQTLSKADMEMLRQALKTLSEAEKQLRLSNDRTTWLTAAVLQLAPDQQYMPRSSSIGTSSNKNRSHTNEPQLHCRLEEIWLQVIENIPIRSIKQLMLQEGKLVELSHDTAPAALLLFSSSKTKSKAENLKSHIIQAFESVLKMPVAVEIKCEPTIAPPSITPTTETIPIEENTASRTDQTHQIQGDGDTNPSRSIVRSKVSLAHIILQHSEGFSQDSGWLKHKAFSIAQKLEQQNMKLESRSKTLLCWNPPIRLSSRKISRLNIRARRPKMLLKSVCYGRCLSGNSPR